MISTEDLVSVMNSLGEKLSEKDAQEMIGQGDYDRDGKIDFYGKKRRIPRNLSISEFAMIIKNRT